MDKTLKILERSFELRIRKVKSDFENGYIGTLERNNSLFELEAFQNKCNNLEFFKSYIDSPKYWSDEEYKEVKELLS